MRIEKNGKRLLIRLRRELDIVELHIFPMKRSSSFGEQRAQRSYAFLHHPPAVRTFQLWVDRFELLTVTPDADPEQHSAFAELVQCCQLLRQQDDFSLWQDNHSQHEANP